MTEKITKRFYSECAGLTIAREHGEYKMVGGQNVRVGEKFSVFSPMGKSVKVGDKVKSFGQLVTSDPEEIEYLERRAVEMGDIMTAEQFSAAITSPQQSLDEKDRTIQQLQSQLAEVLTQQGKLPKTSAAR